MGHSLTQALLQCCCPISEHFATWPLPWRQAPNWVWSLPTSCRLVAKNRVVRLVGWKDLRVSQVSHWYTAFWKPNLTCVYCEKLLWNRNDWFNGGWRGGWPFDVGPCKAAYFAFWVLLGTWFLSQKPCYSVSPFIFQEVTRTNVQWKKPWLVGLYRGLYYPVI